MVDRNKELAVNTVILGIGQLVPKLLSVLLLPLLTSYLSTEEYGNYDLIVSFTSLLIPIATMQIQQAVFRYILTSSDKSDKKKYITSACLYMIVSSVVLYPITFGILRLIGLSGQLSALICLLYFSESLYTFLGQIVRGLGYNEKYSASVIIYSVVNLAVTAILLIGFKYGLVGVLVALTCGYGTSATFMCCSTSLLRYFNPRVFRKDDLKKLLSFSVPMVPSSIAIWVVNMSDRLIIISFLGSAMNGIYAVANKIPTLYSTAYNIFSLAWTETASKVKDDGDPSGYYSMLYKGLFRILIGVMLLLIALTPFIFTVLVNGDYGDAIYQVPILYFGVFFNSFVNFYNGIYIALKRTKNLGFSSFTGAVINAIINIALIRSMGLYAASISTAISFFVIALFRGLDLRRYIRISYDKLDIVVGMLCFIASAVCLHVYNIPALVLCWIVAIVYNITMNRKFAFSLIKKDGFKRIMQPLSGCGDE